MPNVRGTAAMIHIGDVGAIASPVKPAPASPAPAPEPESCTDNFDRIVASGWGTGPLGAWSWVTTQPASWVDTSASVDGSHGVIAPSPNSSWAEATVPLSPPGVPVELLAKFYLRVNGRHGESEQYGLWLVSDVTPFDFASFWVEPSGTGTNFNQALSVLMDNRVGGVHGGDVVATDLFEQPATDIEEYIEWTLWLRMRVEADGSNGECKGKIWLDGDPEPVGWLEDPNNEAFGPDYGTAEFNGAGVAGGHATDGVTSTLFRLDSFEIVEGC